MAGQRPSDLPPTLRAMLNNPDERLIYDGSRTTGPLAQIHPDLATAAVFHEETSLYEVQRPVLSVPRPVANNAELKERISSYVKQHPKLDIQATQSDWDTILQNIRVAEDKYKTNGEKNIFRKIFGNSDLPDALTLGAKMVPEEYGGSLIRTVLVTVFKVWKGHIENKEKILKSLVDIPDIFAGARDRWAIHQDDEELLAKITELYEAVKDGVATLIDQLAGSPPHGVSKFKAHVVRKLRPDKSASRIEEILGLINKKKEAFQQCVDNLESRINVDTHCTVRTLRIEMAQMKDEILAALDQQKRCVEEKRLQSRTSNSRELEDKNNLLNATYQMCVETTYKQDVQARSTIRLQGPLIQSPRVVITQPLQQPAAQEWAQAPEDPADRSLRIQGLLVDALAVHDCYSLADRDWVLRRGRAMKADAIARGRYLLKTEMFQHFMQSQMSDLLLVDGHCGIRERTSPISVVCASLTVAIEQVPGSLVLYFFCGQHNRDQDPIGGPSGLMRSLVWELLLSRNQTYDLNWVENGLLNAVACFDLESLCYLFKQCVWQLNSVNTLYCILDNVSDFETTDEMFQVLGCFQQIINSPGWGPVLKVMMTCANRSTKLFESVEKRVSLRAGKKYGFEKSESAMMRDISEIVR